MIMPFIIVTWRDPPVYCELLKVNEDFSCEFARRLEDTFNKRAAGMPAASYDDKHPLTRRVNAELRRLGLAFFAI